MPYPITLKRINILLFAILSLALFSCEKDEFSATDTTSENLSTPVSEHYSFDESGKRLYFNSISDFQGLVQTIRAAEAPEAKIRELIEPAVSKGFFLPMYPFYELEKMEEEQIRMYADKVIELDQFMSEVTGTANTKSDDEGFDFDSYIGDDVLLNFLNSDGEITIGKKVYHYLPYGLFITSSHEGRKELEALSSDAGRVRSLLENSLSRLGEAYSITDGLEMYIPQKGKATINNWFNPTETVDVTEDFTKDLNQDNLNLCSIRSRSIFNSIFGPSTYCNDEWDNRRRIRTRVFDQNYLLIQTLGMSAKAQSRRFRVWFALRVDELELGCEFLDYQFPPGFEGPSNSFFNGPILGARLSDGTFIGFNGQIIESGPLFDDLKSISDNLPFIPQIDRDDLQVRIFIKFAGINETFQPNDFLDFKDIVDDLIEDQVPAFLRGIDACFDGAQNCLFDPPNFDNRRLEFINLGNERIQVTVQPIERNRRNIANMAHYFDFNTGQFGVSGSAGNLSPDLSNILNTFNYDVLRGLVWGAGSRNGTVRGNYVATSLNN